MMHCQGANHIWSLGEDKWESIENTSIRMLTLGTEIFHDNDAGKSKVSLHHTVSLFCIVTKATTKKIKLITHCLFNIFL